MIEKITITNFKSLVDVTIELDKFNCLVGMNGAGKSTILQVLDFLSQQMYGDLNLWLESRGWESKDLYCRTGSSRAALHGIVFNIEYRLVDGRLLIWFGSFNRTSARLTRENITLIEHTKTPIEDTKTVTSKSLLDVSDNNYKLPDQSFPISFEYQGSLLSQLKDNFLTDEVKELRDAIRNIRSLELLSPHLLRKSSRSQDKDIGAGGEKLSGFLATIKGEKKDHLLKLLQQFYPQLHDFRVATVKGGWKRLVVSEKHIIADGPKVGDTAVIDTEAVLLNDGLLRILAILAQAETSNTSLLLLDEIENGINPEIVKKLVDALVGSSMQILVTSHSPMILNYLDDEVARKSVQFIYKNPEGQTNVRHFFDIPRIAEKLKYMGPGEAFVDTDLNALVNECVELDSHTRLFSAQTLKKLHMKRAAKK